MFELKKHNDVLVITLSGKVTADEVTAFYDRFNAVIDDVDQTGLVIDMTGFDDMTSDAIARDIPLELGLLDQMGKFPKAAIVSDKEFVGAAIQAVNPLVPMIEMRVFGPGDLQAAKSFAADLPPRKPKGKGAQLMDSSDTSVMAFEIDGYIDDDEMETITEEVLARIDRDEEFRLLAKITSFRGFDPEILTEGSFFKMKFGAMKAVKKYAIVTDESWLKPLLGFAGTVSGIDIRQFPLSQEQAAWDWARS